MKKFRKIFSIVLILILSLCVTVSGAACDLSKLEFDFLGGGQNAETVVPDTDGENPPETPTGDDEVSTTLPDNVKFYQYATSFDTAQSTLNLSVNSLEMLAAYMEYVNFFAVTKQVMITVTYAPSFYEEYQKADEIYRNSERIVIGTCSVHIGASGKTGKYYVTESDADTLATKTFDKDKEYVSAQTDYALKMPPQNVRAANYDGFKLNSVTKVLRNIKNSEQLRWAIQNGYKPECVVGSPAESVLNKAKDVLRGIVTDEMDDVTKLRAIYEWLALNVQYDNHAASEFQSNNVLKASEYDSWYAEGVFNNRVAVCEGYAKSLIIMAGLEGIPAIFVTGNGHAWNRVLLDEKWYVVDATHADVHVGASEIFSYGQFMITDAEKTHRGYTSAEYKTCAATTEFNVFGAIKHEHNEQEFDLIVSSKEELRQIFLYAQTKKELGKDCTVDVFVSQADVDNFEDWKDDFDISLFYKNTLVPDYDLSGNAHYTFYLK